MAGGLVAVVAAGAEEAVAVGVDLTDGAGVAVVAPIDTAGRGWAAGSAKLPTEIVRTAAAPRPSADTAGIKIAGLSITPPSRT